MRTSYITFLLIFILFAKTIHAQLLVGAVVGTARSKSFGQYAKEMNTYAGTTKKLNNFNFAYGHTFGVELPRFVLPVGFGFRFQKLTSHAKYQNETAGSYHFTLTQKQYLVPIMVRHMKEKGSNYIIYYLQFPLGITKTNLAQTVTTVNNSVYTRNFSATQMNFGIQGEIAFITKSGFGVSSRIGYLGCLLPLQEFKFDLFDRSFYSTPSAVSLDDYYLNYNGSGKLKKVKADNRNLTVEIGLQYFFMRLLE
jgi:hypothetical protein